MTRISVLITSFFVLFVAVVCFAFFASSLSLYAADSLAAVQPEMQQEHADYIGWGLSYTHSDATQERVGLMFSAMYAHSLSPSFDVEASVHFTGRSNHENRTFPDIRLQYSVMGELTAMFRPFSEPLKGLRVGGGISLRTLAITTSGLRFINDSTLSYIVWQGEKLSLGGHIKAEYVIPLGGNVDLGVRGEVHIFLPPISSYGSFQPFRSPLYPNGGATSLGVLLRIGL